ncbi:MAG: Dcp1p-Dcp2p decapping enzyme complex alpha subunit [Caeruleum heppii]|nr:MAG: Dcp1p-Dcp2p decapping enzyme complex alpha subunit [Caeruleum heppii]
MGGSVPQMPGVKAEPELAHQFRQEVADLLQRRTLSFPGAQPVSFAHRHLQALRTEDYYVCEKSDGIRCLMYFAEGTGGTEIHYLIDRRNDYYYVPQLHFPVPLDPSFQNFHVGTIIDGELVNDTRPNGTVQLNYLVFDCLMLDGNSLMHRPLDKRLAYFRDKVYNPYKALYEKFPEEIQYLPFIVEFKDMELSYGVEMMFRDVLPNLPHGNDGLIFTARNRPYKFGTDEHILKWKPEAENTIDFRLNLEFPLLSSSSPSPPGTPTSPSSTTTSTTSTTSTPAYDYTALPTAHLSINSGSSQGHTHYATLPLPLDLWTSLKSLNQPLNDAVVECALDPVTNSWKYLRLRPDKEDANHVSTVKAVLESIHDRVGMDELIAAAKGWREAWKWREREEREKERLERERERGVNGTGGSAGVKRKVEE